MRKRYAQSKKCFAALLAFVMIFGMIPITAMASDGPLNQIAEPGGINYYNAAGDVVTPNGGNNNLAVSMSNYDAAADVVAPNDANDNWAVSMSKTVSDTLADGTRLPENVFEITLGVQTTEDVEMYQVSPDTAVVLVIDISSSMVYKPGVDTSDFNQFTVANRGHAYDTTTRGGPTGYYTLAKSEPTNSSRMAVAKASAVDFLADYVYGVKDESRWVSLVSFGTDASVVQTWLDVSVEANYKLMLTKIDSLVTRHDPNNTSNNLSTFTQGGLQVALNLLRRDTIESIEVANSFVVMITDGNPTANKTLTATDKAIATDSINSGASSSASESNEYVAPSSNQASLIAKDIKDTGVTLYTVAFALNNSLFRRANANSGNSYNAITWLGNSVASPGCSLAAGDAFALADELEKINQRILTVARAWTVSDKMGEGILFQGDVGNINLDFDSSTDTLTWRLRTWMRTTTQISDTRTIFSYEYKYLITLDTLSDGFEAEVDMPTNELATLFYTIRTADGEYVPFTKEFAQPEVFGFAAPFSFVKVNALNPTQPIPGATFQLYLDAAATDAYGGPITSGEDGIINFGYLPSGHTYYLKELTAPDNFVLDDTTYELKVSYGVLSLVTADGNLTLGSKTFKNAPELRSLTVKKVGEGPIPVGETFTIEVTFSGNGVDQLAESYTSGVKTVNEGADNKYTVTLAVGEEFMFEYLPIGISYQVVEVDLEYDYAAPMYKVDSGDFTSSASGTVPATSATVVVKNTRLEAGIDVNKEVVEKTDVAITPVADADKTYVEGDVIVYRIVIENTGDMALRNVRWAEQPGFDGPYRTYEDALDENSSPFTPRSSGYRLGIGATRTVYYTYTVTISSTPAVPNTVTVSGKDPGGNPVGNTDNEEIYTKHPNLTIEKFIIVDGQEVKREAFASGDTAFFVVRLTNSGNATAENVTLTDVWSGPGNISLDSSTDDLSPNGFDVAPGGTVEFSYSVDLEGMDVAAVEAEFARLMGILETEIEENGSFIETALREQGEATLNLYDAFDPIISIFGYYLNSADEAQVVLNELSMLIAEEEFAFSEDDYTFLVDAYQTYNEIMDEYSDDKIEAAYIAISEAEDKIAYLAEHGLDLEDMIISPTNTASFSYTYGQGSSSVIVDIEPEINPNLTIRKFVSLTEDGPWSKAIVMDSEGGRAYYLIVIENTGTTVETVTLTDSNWPEDYSETYEIGPGGRIEVPYYLDINPNDDFFRAEFVPNTATMETEYGEKNSSALVTVLPQRFAELVINKSVSFNGTRWSKSLSTYSDETVNVLYRVTIMNIGTGTAVFSLTDDQYAGKFYTNAALTNEYAGDINAIELRPLRTLTLYYPGELDETTRNTATYEIADDVVVRSDSNRRGRSRADVTIIPVPTIVVSLTKDVVRADEFNAQNPEATNGWRDSATISNKYGKGTFVFRVTLTNDGNYPVDVKLADAMGNDNVVLDIQEALLLAGIISEDDDEYIALDPYSSAAFYLTVTVSAGSYKNVVTIEEIEHDLPDGFEPEVVKDEDEASVVVSQSDMPEVLLQIFKEVEDVNGNWVSSARFEANSRDVNYRIRVVGTPNDPNNELGGWSISGLVTDSMDVVLENDGAFTIGNGEGMETEAVFAYTVTLGVGEHDNVAVIGSVEYDEDEFVVTVEPDTSEADVTITEPPPVIIITPPPPSGGGDEYYYYEDDSVPPTPIAPVDDDPVVDIIDEEPPLVFLPNQQVPLADLPPDEEDMIIEDPDVPLTTLPKTGLQQIIPFGMFGLGAAAFAGGTILGKKNDENEI